MCFKIKRYDTALAIACANNLLQAYIEPYSSTLSSTLARSTDGISTSLATYFNSLSSSKTSSTSSNFKPLVSGRNLYMKYEYPAHILAKIMNVNPTDIDLIKPRNVDATKKPANLLRATPIITPLDRTRNGNISEISNQDTGPSPMEKKTANKYKPRVSNHNIANIEPKAISK